MKSVLDMSAAEAKEFFLEQKSYSNLNLPEYFNIRKVLKELDEKCNELPKTDISQWYQSAISKEENINHTLYINKDGNSSWRALQLMHPLVYLFLVREITESNNWGKLLGRFRAFQANPKIKCLSVPVKSGTKKPDQAEQILQWWKGVEQESIKLLLDYDYMFHTDIANCYGSIYTHSIAGAIEKKERAKQKRRDESLLGNKIDAYIQIARCGQANGIPQGSVLMDFIAEIVLGRVDELLVEKIKQAEKKEKTKKDDKDYQIVRYRDDYRIFVNNPDKGRFILKLLSEVLISFGLKLNSSKTKESENIIISSIKQDKLAWFNFEWLKLKILKLEYEEEEEIWDMSIRQTFHNAQKRVLLIYQHSLAYPNSGSLVRALSEFNKQMKENEDSLQIVSILVDLMRRNHRAIPICCSIISKILNNIDSALKLAISKKIYKKLNQFSHTEFAQIWFQRMLKDNLQHFEFDDKLCKIVKQEKGVELWNSKWIKSRKIKKVLKSNSVFDKKIFDQMDEVIKNKEVDIFYY